MITPLHIRTGYSLGRGPVELEAMLAAAARLGHASLAVTDVNALYGATRFCALAAKHGLSPIIGAELHTPAFRAVALVESRGGYANLCRLITAAKTADRKGQKELEGKQAKPALCNLGDGRSACAEIRNPKSEMASHQSGLSFIATDVTSARHLQAAGIEPGRLYVGIDPAAQPRAVLHALLQFATDHVLPAIATASACLLTPDDRTAAGLLAAIRMNTTLDNVPDAALPPAGACLRSPADLARQYAAFPQAVETNRRLAERCSAFRLLPREPVFPAYPCEPGQTPARRLRQLCQAGLSHRYGARPSREVLNRLNRELQLIERLGFCEYFLVVHDIVGYARQRNAPVAGRGSGASSIVAYLLGVTNVCPLACNIPFERFLHEQREDFPDLDIDFCWRIRDDVIDYAFDRWGRAPGDPPDAPPSRAAMVCTHQFFKDRSAFRETAKALGLSDAQISRVTRNPQAALRTADDATRQQLTLVLDLSRRIIGLPRSIGLHPGGIVLAPGPIEAIAPLEASAKGPRVIQYDKHGAEAIGLVKIDLLGNRNLSTVRYATTLLTQQGLPHLELTDIPPDDPATLAALCSARTLGCNQLESPAMRHLLAAMQPTHMLDVMKTLALIRPGAASIGMKDAFIRRHSGEDPLPPLPAAVARVLVDSHGVMLYEDDVMTVVAATTGLDLPAADRFRRAIQKCFDDETRRDLSARFLALCREHGTGLNVARNLWVQMAKFNAYSFCRAHAGSYAQLAYAGAYLKTHHPLAFWTAALNNNQSMYHPRLYLDEARRDGIATLGPDANRSAEEFSIDPNQPCALRAGLACIEGLGKISVRKLLDARQATGAFTGLGDLLARTGLAEPEARALILAGALDSLGENRPTRIMQLDLLARHRRTAPSLLAPDDPRIDPPPPDFDSERKRLDEWRLTGLSFAQPFIAHYRPALRPHVNATRRDLPQRIGRRVRIAGVLEARRVARTMPGEPGIAPLGMNRDGPRDYGGKPMMFLTLADEWGVFEATVFPDAYRRLGRRASGYGPFILTGTVEQQHNVLSITADDLYFYQQQPETLPA